MELGSWIENCVLAKKDKDLLYLLLKLLPRIPLDSIAKLPDSGRIRESLRMITRPMQVWTAEMKNTASRLLIRWHRFEKNVIEEKRSEAVKLEQDQELKRLANEKVAATESARAAETAALEAQSRALMLKKSVQDSLQPNVHLGSVDFEEFRNQIKRNEVSMTAEHRNQSYLFKQRGNFQTAEKL